jgi:signal transduction histidine kinase
MNRTAWLRFAIGLAVPFVALGAKAALDEAIEPQPWIVVTLFAVTLVSWVSGPMYGVLATLIILVSELAGIPPVAARPSPIIQATPALEIVTGIIAVLFGATIRVTRVREQRSHETALRVSRASADLDRRWRILREAVTEFADVSTGIQATDLLIRRVTELTGARHVDVVHSPGGSGDLPQTLQRSGHSILLPILGESGALGALRLEFAAGDADAVEDEDLGASLALARLCGAALDRIRLLSEGGSARHRASRSGERLDRLQRLTTALAAAVTPEAIGEAIVRHTLETLGASVGLFYVTESGGELRLAHARGYPIGLAGNDARLRRDVALPAVDAARTGEMVVVESHEAWRTAYPGTSDRLGITGTRSLVAVPIGHPATGVLVVQRSTQDALSEDDASFLDVVSHQATQALERSRLYAHEREARQLQEAFIGVMSHELRTPITTILAGSKLLARSIMVDERSRDLATDIEVEADRLFRLIEDLLVLSRLERGNLALSDEPVHVVRVVERVVASESGRWPSTVFELPDERKAFLVRGDETYIEQILRNLLANAAKYSPEGSTVRIEIDGGDEEVAVRVLDEGPGVAAAEVEQLFSLFYRSPTTAASAAGGGIGLFVCRRLIDEMGGHIWARLREPSGSEFGFALAVYPTDEIDDFEAPVDNAGVPDAGTPVEAPAQPPVAVSPTETAPLPIGRAEP